VTTGGSDLLSQLGNLGVRRFQAMEDAARLLPIIGDTFQRIGAKADDQASLNIHAIRLRSRAAHDQGTRDKRDRSVHLVILLLFSSCVCS
jgi:hypothetical protein